MSSSVPAPAEMEYPSADGKPVAESDFQLNSLIYARERLRIYFRDECKRNDVYQEGNSGASVAPAVFAVIGVPNRDRSAYLLWQERKASDFVLEITSRTTRGEDQGRKRERYRALGVKEYWQFDPTGDYPEPPLQGRELIAGGYVRMPGRAGGRGPGAGERRAGTGTARHGERAALL